MIACGLSGSRIADDSTAVHSTETSSENQPLDLAPGPAPTSRGNSGNRPLSERAVTMRCRETCRYVSRRHARKSQDADFLQHPKIHGVGTHPAVLTVEECALEPGVPGRRLEERRRT